MLKKIQVIALSAVFLLHAFGMLQAHSLSILPDGDNVEPTQPVIQLPIGGDTPAKASAPSTRKPESGKRKTDRPAKLAPTPQILKPKGPSPSKDPKIGHLFPDRLSRNSPLIPRSKSLAERVAEAYENLTGKQIVIRSGKRDALQQATAMFKNARAFGLRSVITTYRNKRAVREIMAPYQANRRRPRKAQREMARVIESQMARGIYISNHLRGRAVDVRSRGRGAARLSILRQVARSLGGYVLVERSHYHVTLT